jgi:3D (Asp-Asp-Asp) domain-containing protein
MRHSRPLTKSENWELAILLIIMVVVLVGGTLIWRLSRVPHLWAIMPPRVAMAITNTSTAGNVAARTFVPMRPAAVRAAPAIQSRPTIAPKPAGRLIHRQMVRRRVIRHTDSYWYHGKRYVYWKTLFLRVTSYAPDRKCCWPYPGTTTASGKSVWTNDGHLVAADTRLIPFNAMVRVPGYDYDHPVPVLDRGGAIHGYRLDVLAPTFWSAQHWGVKLLRVKIYRPVARW